ncbi:MAG: insulinase family protein [Pyrinomonadaceae bacterium]|nr:insulinase family protein [Pyrinomonadaceae bacterium]
MSARRDFSIVYTFIKGLAISGSLLALTAVSIGQTPSETPPPPGEPPGLTLPDVKEKTLPNGLKVVVVQRRNVPLVTASLLVRSGASSEQPAKAGVASMTADMLPKGTAFATSTQIAQQIDFLGASLGTGAGWNGSSATVTVMTDKLGKALSIMSECVVRPTFPAKEVALYKKQAMDGFKVSMKQPGSLLSYVSAVYSFMEHPASGTESTVRRIRRSDLVKYHKTNYVPGNAVLVFTGDIKPETAFGYARLFFGGWSGEMPPARKSGDAVETLSERPPTINRMLVINLPDSGQAAVGFANALTTGRLGSKRDFFSATVLNSVLGGGYSARLNQEIRLKRGLSYGARSGFSWRPGNSTFLASAQTKNESAAQVAELVKIEIEKLINESIANTEMVPRKAVVTGSFGRSLQTNSGLANQLRNLYAFGLDASELNSFMSSVQEISANDIKGFAGNYLSGGDMIIVGDASKFMDDLKKRFPDQEVEVIDAAKLKLNRASLK